VDGALVVRRAHTRFEGRERLFVSLPLRHACANVACPDGQTCAAGACVSAEVSSGALVTYDEALTRSDGRFCFPRSDCFEDVIPAVLANPDDCTFQLPDEVPDDAKNRGFGNLEILHDDLSREVLDQDPVEGFTRVPGTNDKFRLAPGLCARYRSRTVASLYIGANCPPKEPLRPMCHGSPPDAAAPEDVLCTSAAELAPTPVAVYLLVDRSSAMQQALPPLHDAIDAALQAQFLRNAKVALGLLPAPAGACIATPSPFATLDGPDAVPFGAPGDARGPIGAILGDASRVLPDNPPLYLDAALRADSGAYAALLGQNAPLRFAVVIGNRDFVDHCAPTVGTPVQEAFVASRDHALKTAALLAGSPPGFVTGRDDLIDALAMARAGGGPFGDASLDVPSLRAAVASFITEIGTCRYDLPPSIDTSVDLTQVKVSYFDVLDSVRVDVPYDPTCNDGWRLEDGRVHVCGAACGVLHFQVATAAAYSIAHGFAPVDAPVRWAAPCK
jgi:hypothetical protein